MSRQHYELDAPKAINFTLTKIPVDLSALLGVWKLEMFSTLCNQFGVAAGEDPGLWSRGPDPQSEWEVGLLLEFNVDTSVSIYNPLLS